MKFTIEMTVDFDGFDIPTNKSLSMINAMQREQVANAVQSALKAMKPQIHNVYKQRTNG
jgi:hypothetical protein